MRSATRVGTPHRVLANVSIHALLAECDRAAAQAFPPCSCFNPRTPCGVRLLSVAVLTCRGAFQSTHSLRSATLIRIIRLPPRGRFQSTHSLRSATDDDFSLAAFGEVSIHALLAECDLVNPDQNRRHRRFNPRTPCGVRPRICVNRPYLQGVSIHALLAECDLILDVSGNERAGFNPRTPCGVRRDHPEESDILKAFQSTHSLRSATILKV